MALKRRAVVFLLGARITGCLTATPIYTPTYVSLNYVVDLGIGGGQWSYLGPGLSINGSDEFSLPLPNTIQPNTPFVVSVPVLPVQGEAASGLEQTKSYAGGMDVSRYGLFGSVVLTGGPFVLAPGQYSESLPVTLTGTTYACNSAMYGIDCFTSDTDAAFYINLDVLGVMTVDAAEGKYGSTTFVSANFTSVPEPPAVWMLIAGIIVLATVGSCTRVLH